MEENVSEALIMAASVLIFVVALSVIFSLISQAKTTTDALIYSQDDTKYYTDDLEGITFITPKGKDRIVGIDAVMATAYRYAKEHYGVTIMDEKGNFIARFDEETESVAQNWPNYESKNNTEARNKQLVKLQNIQKAAGITENVFGSFVELTNLWKQIYQLDKIRS